MGTTTGNPAGHPRRFSQSPRRGCGDHIAGGSNAARGATDGPRPRWHGRQRAPLRGEHGACSDPRWRGDSTSGGRPARAGTHPASRHGPVQNLPSASRRRHPPAARENDPTADVLAAEGSPRTRGRHRGPRPQQGFRSDTAHQYSVPASGRCAATPTLREGSRWMAPRSRS